MTGISSNVIRYAVMLAILLEISTNVNAGKCSSHRTSRKNQAARLHKLASNEVVVESTYMGTLSGSHRFLIEQVWMKNNGSLKRFDEISVDPGSFASCYEQLKLRETYILMLVPIGSARNQLSAIEAPVSSRRRKHRHAVWNGLCSSDGGACPMRITVPPSTVFYEGWMKIIQCKVESSSPVTEVVWLKNGNNIDSHIYRSAGLYVDTSDKENSYIMIQSASHTHNGKYHCQARNADGQMARAETRIAVIGPQMDTYFTECKDTSFCFNGGICKQSIDETMEPICQCQPGFEGSRCGEMTDDITAGVAEPDQGSDPSNQHTSNSGLNLAVVLLAAALVCVIVCSFLYVMKLKKKISGSDDDYTVVEQCCGREQGKVTTNVYTDSSNGTSVVRLTKTDASPVASRHSSAAASPSRNSNQLRTSLLLVDNEISSPEGTDKMQSSPRNSSNKLSRSSSGRSRLSACSQ
ncbi:unnamed protein product [Clavelina lepadiformis]|uniref:Uncharacterized protein n=1 Tax=Clavelina lepadiformis TaxID=159417 RepID=A0ABP0FSF7_CLALP